MEAKGNTQCQNKFIEEVRRMSPVQWCNRFEF